MARAKTPDKLAPYREKRDFKKTPEPPAKVKRRSGNSFVIQKHAATRTHFDFRLEHDGVLWSWAVTKGPSYDPAQKRLAVRTEDHPLEYGGFEGIIPKGEYGAGPVMIWDRGTWEPLSDPAQGIEDGNLKFILHGERLKGEWALIRMKADKRGSKRENWLLIKKRDEHARDGGEPTEFFLTSVKSGRDMEQLRRGEVPVWSSNRPKQAEEKRHSPVKTSGRSKRLKAPDFIAPQLATLVDEVPDGDAWLHEVKYDGYRIIGRKAGDDVTLFSRRGLDWTRRFPTIAEAMRSVPAEVALFDGEIAYVLPDGITDFKSMQEHIDTPDPAIRYFVFDLLWLDGKHLRDLPLVERKARLESLLGEGRATDWIIYSGDVAGSGETFFNEACKSGLEGIISKRKDAPYRSGRSKSWLKIKCGKRAEFVIGGFSKSAAKRPFASLLLGTFEDGKLVYAGKVGTGFNNADREMLAKRFKAMKRKTSPFADVPKAEARDAQWIEPRLVCEIAFTEWTRDGRLRHPSFQGLREDKIARDVQREGAAEDGRAAREEPMQEGDGAMFAGVTLSSPDKVLYPDIDFTKLDLARYYEAVAGDMLRFVSDRPISLVRCPEGCQKECFFQRHIMKGMSKAVKEVTVAASKSKRKFIYIDDEAGLFSLVQIGVLEIHDWGCTVERLEQPDRVVFDLDPDEGFPFPELKAAAKEVRAFLQELGLESFLKVTGGKGLHLVAPIAPKLHWDEVKAFTKAVADALVAVRGDRYTSNPLKRTRKGKIFVDYLRNQRGGSAIANYSTRAKAGAPVAVPLAWEELSGLKSAAPYTIRNLPARLRALKSDPWEGFFAARQSITAKARKALGLG
jgi:bifunctional non-homologous end joining protein LigD